MQGRRGRRSHGRWAEVCCPNAESNDCDSSGTSAGLCGCAGGARRDRRGESATCPDHRRQRRRQPSGGDRSGPAGPDATAPGRCDLRGQLCPAAQDRAAPATSRSERRRRHAAAVGQRARGARRRAAAARSCAPSNSHPGASHGARRAPLAGDRACASPPLGPATSSRSATGRRPIAASCPPISSSTASSCVATPTTGQKRGVALNSASTSIRNSYIGGIRLAGQETQGIAGWNGPGPFVIENNYVEAAEHRHPVRRRPSRPSIS